MKKIVKFFAKKMGNFFGKNCLKICDFLEKKLNKKREFGERKGGDQVKI